MSADCGSVSGALMTSQAPIMSGRPRLNPGDAGGPLVGAWHEGCAPPFTRVFTSLSPERGRDACTVTCVFTSSTPHVRWVADPSRRRSRRRPPVELGGLGSVLREATQPEKASIYHGLGLQLVYHPADKAVVATADLGRVLSRVGGGT